MKKYTTANIKIKGANCPNPSILIFNYGYALHGLVRTEARQRLQLFNVGQMVHLRMGLRSDLSDPVGLLEREETGALVPADEVGLVVGHVEGREERRHEVDELVIRLL